MEENEAALVELARRGNFDAFESLAALTENRIYGHLLRLVGNPDDARDLMQESYLNAYRNLPGFKGQSSFSTWLYRIATNQAFMMLRKKRPETETIEDLNIPSHEELKRRNIHNWAMNPKEALLRKEVRLLLEEAIQKLPPSYKAVVLLRDIEEMSTAETAKVLGLSEGAVKTRLHRARVYLRESLSPYFESNEVAAVGGA